MATATLGATLSLSVWLPLLLHLQSCHWSSAKPFAQTINTATVYLLLLPVSLQTIEKSLFPVPKCGARILALLGFVLWNSRREDIDDVPARFLNLASRRRDPGENVFACLALATKRSALLLHVWRLSITKRLLCASERHRKGAGRSLCLQDGF